VQGLHRPARWRQGDGLHRPSRESREQPRLAWDCGVTFDEESGFRENSAELRSRLYHRAVLAALCPHVAVDVLALDELKRCQQVEPELGWARFSGWLTGSVALGHEIVAALNEPADAVETGQLSMGDIVTMAGSQLPYVVFRPGVTTELIDFGERFKSFRWSRRHLHLLPFSHRKFHSSVYGL